MSELGRLFLSGPITSGAGDARARFSRAAAQLVAVGFDVVSPLDAGRLPGDTPEGEAPNGALWGAYVRRGLLEMLAPGVTGVAVLDGHERSRGCRVEVGVAVSVGLPVCPVGSWVAAGRDPETAGLLAANPDLYAEIRAAEAELGAGLCVDGRGELARLRALRGA